MMNGIYNIWQNQDRALLKKYHLSLQFADKDQKFVGRLAILLYVQNYKEAKAVHDALKKSITQELGLLVYQDTGLADVSIEIVRRQKEIEIQQMAEGKLLETIQIETIFGKMSVRNVGHLGTEITANTGTQTRIKQHIDLIIIKDERNFCLHHSPVTIEIDLTCNVHDLDSLLLLAKVSPQKVRDRLETTDLVYFDQSKLDEVEKLMAVAGVEYSLFEFGDKSNPILELSVE